MIIVPALAWNPVILRLPPWSWKVPLSLPAKEPKAPALLTANSPPWLPWPVSCVLSVALPPKVSPVWSVTVSLAPSPPWKTRQLKRVKPSAKVSP
jgi:hypothetical protein